MGPLIKMKLLKLKINDKKKLNDNLQNCGFYLCCICPSVSPDSSNNISLMLFKLPFQFLFANGFPKLPGDTISLQLIKQIKWSFAVLVY